MNPYRLLILFVVLGAVAPVLGQQYSRNPEPFRGDDEIEGRADFEYNEESFLHRFAYRFAPGWGFRWDVDSRQGYRGTAGSTRSDEFYLVQELQKTISLEYPYFFSFVHERQEDFDSRFDRTLIGGGVELPHDWTLSVFGEIVGEKEEIDLHLELNWSDGKGSRFRAAFLAVDFLFNDKNPQSREYDQEPFTYFAHGVWAGPGGMELQGWLNYNSHLRQERPVDGFDFTYDQFMGGVSALQPFSERWALYTFFRGEFGQRQRKGFDPTFVGERDFSRRSADLSVELKHLYSETVRVWFGGRYFRLSERDAQPNNLAAQGRTQRREKMVYGGIAWRFRERMSFLPAVYLNYIDNREDFPLDPGRDDKDSGFVGKLALPLEVTLTPAGNSFLVFSPSVLLHKFAFGGANVQLQIPF